MLKLSEEDRRQHVASWHNDAAVNERQAQALAADVNATKNKLLREAVALHLGRIPSDNTISKLVTERKEPKTPLIWVCWGDQAIAVRTEAASWIKDKRYYLTWYWRTLPKT